MKRLTAAGCSRQSLPAMGAEDFPAFRGRRRFPLALSARTLADVFDAFLRHEAARVARVDLAPVTLTAHRQIPDRIWRLRRLDRLCSAAGRS